MENEIDTIKSEERARKVTILKERWEKYKKDHPERSFINHQNRTYDHPKYDKDAVMLDVMNGVPLSTICETHNIPRHTVYNLQYAYKKKGYLSPGKDGYPLPQHKKP